MRQKFFDLIPLSCKCFYRTHSCQIFFGDRRQRSIFFADFFIYRIQPVLHNNRRNAADCHSCHRHKRQLRTQLKHAVQYECHMNRNFNRQHADKSKGIPDSVHIILDPCHQLSGICMIKIPSRQRLHMPKQVFAQLRSNFRT